MLLHEKIEHIIYRIFLFRNRASHHGELTGGWSLSVVQEAVETGLNAPKRELAPMRKYSLFTQPGPSMLLTRAVNSRASFQVLRPPAGL